MVEAARDQTAPSCAASFPSTQWTMVLRAGVCDALSRAALEELCCAYWSPLYAFLRRSEPELSSHDAKDLVQGFLARLIERRDLESVAPEKGRFRTYLLAGLRNFRIKHALHQKAAKRDWRRQVPLLDTDHAEVLCGPDLREGVSPEQAYDRQFARVALSRAMEALRLEHSARGKEALFAGLAPFLDGNDRGDYVSIASRLGLRPGTAVVTVHRMRARLRTLLKAEIANTVSPGVDVESELRSLLEVLTSG
jgi:RNA polymerase sigma-70 factor (ECF subfamily)